MRINLLMGVGALLFGLVAFIPAHASPCGVVHFPHVSYGHQVHYAAPVRHYDDYEVKKRVVVLEYQLIPPFPIGYAAPYTAPAPAVVAPAVSPCDAKVGALEEKLKVLEAKLAGNGRPPDALPLEAPKAKTFVAKCAGCHNDKEAATKGGKLTLFSNGAPVLWTAETAGKVLKEISSGRMPKGQKLTPEEFSVLAQELFDLSSSK